MSTRATFLLSAAAALGVLALLDAVTDPVPGERHFEIFTEMAYSRAYESYAPNPWFADGKTLQPLVAGVVPRGSLPFAYGPGPEEALRAGADLTNPVAPDDAAALAAGADLFRIYCLPCHDARGTGHGPVVLRGMLPPPSLHAARATGMADGELFHVLTLGQGNMAPVATQLAPLERWAVIRHVRRLQEEGP